MRTFLISFTILFFISCRNNTIDKANDIYMKIPIGTLIPVFDSIHWNQKVLSGIDSFLKEGNCVKCINEIYIDKILPDYSLITLKSRVYSTKYLNNCHPLFFTNFYGKYFYVYTGIEDIVKGDKKHMPIIRDSTNNTFITWTLIIKGDSLRIVKNLGYPFFPPDELLQH